MLMAYLYTLNAAAGDVASVAPSQLQSRPISSPATGDRSNVDVFITAGARSMWGAAWGIIPMPPTAGFWVDKGKLRLRLDVGYHPYANLGYAVVGGGMVFTPKGKNAPQTGGLQVKLPVMADLGFMSGELEAGDGYRDNITWMLLGPAGGVDLVWWKSNRYGFVVSFKTAVQFRIDIDSQYADETYSSHKDVIANLDTALLFGIVI